MEPATFFLLRLEVGFGLKSSLRACRVSEKLKL